MPISVDDLREENSRIKTFHPSGTPWDSHRAVIQKDIENQDPMEFLKWPTIRGTMYVGQGPAVAMEFVTLSAEKRALCLHGAHRFGGDDMKGLDPNLVHQVYHLQEWEKLGRPVNQMEVITEFGGGYGAMAQAVYRSGFQGFYRIIDFPEFLNLQMFYLSNVLEPSQYAQIAFTPIIPDKLDSDLVIAVASLSEAPIMTRNAVLRSSTGASGYLIYFQSQYSGINNTEYFTDWFIEMGEKPGWTGRASQPPYHKDGWYICAIKGVENGEAKEI